MCIKIYSILDGLPDLDHPPIIRDSGLDYGYVSPRASPRLRLLRRAPAALALAPRIASTSPRLDRLAHPACLARLARLAHLASFNDEIAVGGHLAMHAADTPSLIFY